MGTIQTPLEALREQWERYFQQVGHDFQFLSRTVEVWPGCPLILSRLGNYRPRRRLEGDLCALCDCLEDEARLHHEALNLDGTYHFHVNIYPTVPYVVIFCHQKHISMEANVVNYPCDLQRMLGVANATGVSIFHNMRQAASSIPEHEHFQGLLFQVPIKRWPREAIGELAETELLTIPMLPGINYGFRGANPVPAVVRYLKALRKTPYTLAILGDPTEILVFPRRNEKSLHPERRWGGTEMLGTFACRQDMFELPDEEIVPQLIANYNHVLFPPGSLPRPDVV